MPLFDQNNNIGLQGKTKKTEIPAGLWLKCAGCDTVLFRSSLIANDLICPNCGYYYPLASDQRIVQLTDVGTFREINGKMQSVDVLDFYGDGSYPQKLVQNRNKTGMNDAMVTGIARLDGRKYALGVMDFRFMGASMGSVVGEKMTRLTECAMRYHLPLVVVTASGGARMQEGTLSLMQMAKTAGALNLYRKEHPFIVILTNPTTGGVTASFASLGDIILAEPRALVGFAGQRVIRQTTNSELPDGFQTSEYLLEHGFIDRIVERKKLREEVSRLLSIFKK